MLVRTLTISAPGSYVFVFTPEKEDDKCYIMPAESESQSNSGPTSERGFDYARSVVLSVVLCTAAAALIFGRRRETSADSRRGFTGRDH